jgi:hypothetical protein
VKPDGTEVATFNPDRMWTGGIMMNEDGAVLSSGEGGIMWNHPAPAARLADPRDRRPSNQRHQRDDAGRQRRHVLRLG